MSNNKIYSDDVKECHDKIRDLRKEIKEQRELTKRKASEKTYYKGLYEKEKRSKSLLKNRIKEMAEKNRQQKQQIKELNQEIDELKHQLTLEQPIKYIVEPGTTLVWQ